MKLLCRVIYFQKVELKLPEFSGKFEIISSAESTSFSIINGQMSIAQQKSTHWYLLKKVIS